MAPALIARGNDAIGIIRVHNEFVDARVLIDLQDQPPSLPAVRRLIKTAITAAVPKGTLGRKKSRVRVIRMDPDLADMA